MTDKTETKQAELIDTGLVTLTFAALKSPTKKYNSSDTEYKVRAEKWHSEADASDLSKKLESINKDLVLNVHRIKKESELSHADNFIFNAATRDRPIVLDVDKNILSPEEIPMIKSATARLKVTPFEGKNGKGGGLNLVAVQLIDFEPYEGSGQAYDPDEIKAAF